MTTRASRRRGFGIAAGIDPVLARELGRLCADLGFTSLWSNDHPAASGIATASHLGSDSGDVTLGVGALALDRHAPASVARAIEESGVDPTRLLLALGSGFSRRPLGVVRDGIEAMRATLPGGTGLAVAAMGPKMCELGGEIADAVFLNWMTPERCAWARRHVEAGARRGGRPVPPIYGYVRVAVDERAGARLEKEESFYRTLHAAYERHFERLGVPLGTLGVATTDRDAVRSTLSSYATALDEPVVRALASANLEAMREVAEVAAPPSDLSPPQ